MKNKNLKTYEQYVFNNILLEDFFLDDIESTQKIDNIFKKIYERIYFNQLLMMDVIGDNLLESLDDVVSKIYRNDWDKNPNNFYDSFMLSKRLEFLNPYTINDIKDFDLYKVDGYNIGFAIKKDGEITLIHNNEENINGIGKQLISKSLQFGGNKLDHFDGFLTGYYKNFNFKFKSNDIFKLEYKPKNWKFETVDINNHLTSVYVDEIIVNENIFKNAKKRYKNGMPDIIFRTI